MHVRFNPFTKQVLKIKITNNKTKQDAAKTYLSYD